MDYLRKIFVFGSNLSGWHGRGAAREAKDRYGAKQGKGVGHFGGSYAIPTKGYGPKLPILSLNVISKYVNEFVDFAKAHPDWEFNITPIGTGLAGYAHSEIAPLFKDCPENCNLPEEWKIYLTKE